MAWLIYKNSDGQLICQYSYAAQHEIRAAIEARIFELQHEGQEIFWRATNNRDEDKICNNIRSKNHRDEHAEAGLSVAHDPESYQILHGYKFIYPVRGRVIGRGSDGEPILEPGSIEALDRPRKKPLKRWIAATAERPTPISYQDIASIRMEYGIEAISNELIVMTPQKDALGATGVRS